MSTMHRFTLSLALFLTAGFILGQNTIYTHAIGNWRNGPTVYITPVLETTEAASRSDLEARFKEEFAEIDAATDMDVLLFATKEEAELSRVTLKSKYGVRKLPVVMLEAKEPVEGE